MIRGSSGADKSKAKEKQHLAPSETENLAKEAGCLWLRGEYSECVSILEELKAERGDDLKVVTNLLAAKALAQEEHSTNAISLVEIQDVEKKATTNNILLVLSTATILFRSQQFSAALRLLEPIWLDIQRSPDALILEEAGLATAFLLVDLFFSVRKLTEAAAVVSWLEQKYDLVAEDREEQEGRSSSTPDHGLRDDSVHSGDFPQQVSPSSLGSADQVSRVVAGYNVTQLVLSYRAQLNIMAGNLKGAKRDIRNLLSLDPRNNLGLSLKAELEALRGNLRRAGKIVTACPEGVNLSQGEKIQMLCNMGYIQHCERKHHTATLCYSKAMQAAAGCQKPLLPASDIQIQAVSDFGREVDLALAYNCGIQAMRTKQLDLALQCFQSCAVHMRENPLLWLRMAECCVEASVLETPLQSALDSFAAGKEGVSSHCKRGLLINSALVQTIEHGKQCASNAVSLFSQRRAEGEELQSQLESKIREGSPEALSSLQTAIANQAKRSQTAGKLAALSARAFLCLQLDQPASALLHAKDILEEADVSSPEWHLGQAYASEALYQLDEASAAAEHLQAALAAILEEPAMAHKSENGGMSHTQDVADLGLDSLSNTMDSHSIRLLLLVNLASAYFTLDEYTQAYEFAKTGAEDVESRDAMLMHVYLQLCRGETTSAIAQLKSFQLGLSQDP